MTEKQKSKIIRMREHGASFSKIAELTGISRNTIKSYCRRKNIKIQETVAEANGLKCKYCKKPLKAIAGRKQPKFCCSKCRIKWWNSHPEEVDRKAVYSFICVGCGKEFSAYGNKKRKFCSHSCYITTRFGGDEL